MLGSGLQCGHNAVIVIVRVGIGFREPDHFFAVYALTVDDSGNLPVGAACVKADAAAFQMTADGLGKALFFGHSVYPQHFKGVLEYVAHVIKIECPGAVERVMLLHGVANGLVAAEVNAETALHPQQRFNQTVNIIDVRLTIFLGSVNLGVHSGHLTLRTLHSHGERLPGVCQKCLVKTAQGNELRIQRRQVPYRNVNAQILHIVYPPQITLSNVLSDVCILSQIQTISFYPRGQGDRKIFYSILDGTSGRKYNVADQIRQYSFMIEQ